MDQYACDILVIGGGPAGSSAAMAASQKGMRVILVDRKSLIGVPVRCAEHIPAQLVGKVRPAKGFAVQKVKGMKTVLPDGTAKETAAPGWIIRRDFFDQALAEEAKKAGAELMLSTRALQRISDGVLIKKKGEAPLEVKTKVIIGADGPHSRAGKWIGSENKNFLSGIQVSVPLKEPMDIVEVYFDEAFFGGYGWVFPKGKYANVGIGMRIRKDKPDYLKKALNRFLGLLETVNKIDGKSIDLSTGITFGFIPVEPLEKINKDNILLTGDAAGLTHPITGAGIAPAVISGRMAGKWAARAVESDDLKLLSEYGKECQEFFKESLMRAFNRRMTMEKEWNRLEEIIPKCWVAFREYYAEP